MACAANGARVSRASPSVPFVTIIHVCERRLIRNTYASLLRKKEKIRLILTSLNCVVRRTTVTFENEREKERLRRLRNYRFWNKTETRLIHSPWCFLNISVCSNDARWNSRRQSSHAWRAKNLQKLSAPFDCAHEKISRQISTKYSSLLASSFRCGTIFSRIANGNNGGTSSAVSCAATF